MPRTLIHSFTQTDAPDPEAPDYIEVHQHGIDDDHGIRFTARGAEGSDHVVTVHLTVDQAKNLARSILERAEEKPKA